MEIKSTLIQPAIPGSSSVEILIADDAEASGQFVRIRVLVESVGIERLPELHRAALVAARTAIAEEIRKVQALDG